jgi:hypothetical protein
VNECRELAAGVRERALDLAKVDRDLVEQDQRRLIAEQLAQDFRTRGDVFLVGIAEAFIRCRAAELISEFAPKAEGAQAGLELAAVGGVGVLAIKRCDAHAAGGQQDGIDEVGDVGHAFHAARRVRDGDQAVRLTAPILSAQADDGRYFPTLAGQAQADGLHQLAQPAGREGIAEEEHGVKVVAQRRAIDYLGQVGHELLVAGGAAEHVRPRSTCGENGR